MANKIYNLPEASLKFVSSGGDVTLDLGSLANGAGRVSDQHDRGSGAKPGLYQIQAIIKAAAALAAGAQLFVYLLQTHVSADVPGNLGTSDTGVSSSDKQRNLGAPTVVINADSTSNGENQISNANVVEIYGRYVSVMVWNALGQALHSTGTNSYVRLTPVPPEVQ